jgi:hypothetical protein
MECDDYLRDQAEQYRRMRRDLLGLGALCRFFVAEDFFDMSG